MDITPEEREAAIARIVKEDRVKAGYASLERRYNQADVPSRSWMQAPAAPEQDITYTGVTLTAEQLKRRALRGACFDGARITGDLDNARLQDCSFVGADFHGCSLIGVHLERATLRGARFDGCMLLEAHLDQADLTGASLVGAHLERARLVGATLTGAQSAGAVLTGADLRDVTW